jgi:hypothetical protein
MEVNGGIQVVMNFVGMRVGMMMCGIRACDRKWAATVLARQDGW